MVCPRDVETALASATLCLADVVLAKMPRRDAKGTRMVCGVLAGYDDG